MLPRQATVAVGRREEDDLQGLRLAGFGAALLAGLAGWAAHPPVGAGWLVYLPVPLLLVSVRLVTTSGTARGDGRRAALAGLIAGLVTFGPMIWWIAEPAGWLGWGLLTLMEAGFYAAAAALLARWVRSAWIVALAPLVWTGMEAWRGLFPLNGFGWGALAYAHVDGSLLLPLARLIGGSGLSLVTVLLGALLYDAGRRAATSAREHQGWAWAAAPIGAAAGVVVLALVVAPDAPRPRGERVDVLAIQGNDLYKTRLFGRDEDIAIAEQMVDETRAAVERDGRPDLTIWPEASVDSDPYTPSGDYLLPYVQEVAALVESGFLVGANLDGQRRGTYENSALLLDDDAAVVDRYVKRRLVPFGEYVPMRELLGGFPPLRQVPRDAVPGGGPRVLTSRGTSIAVLICFETLFPSLVRENVLGDGESGGEADIIVAITNDASFGRSAESDQHIAQSQLRAVETGRWVVHAALSGRSALVDPSGNVHVRTGVFERATIRADVPLVGGRTPFLSSGDVVGPAARWGVLLLVLVPLGAGVARRRSARQPEEAT